MKTLLLLLAPVIVAASVWPENIGEWRRVSVQPATVADRAIWNEYGFHEAQSARFELEDKSFTATAWRLEDSTGAMGAFKWQRPADAKPFGSEGLAAEIAGGVLLAAGNYVVSIQGHRFAAEELSAILENLPRLYNAPLPALPDFMPADNMVPNSERYVLGPAALARFEPRIPPSVAGFHYGVEASLATFRGKGGDLQLALFNYPTPQLAMQQHEAFSKIPGAMAKRSGPLIAVVLSPPDLDAAEHLLSLVRYQAAVTMHEYVPTRRDNVGHLILTIFQLIGILLLFALFSGLAVGGFRFLIRRGAKGQDADPMIMLHLDDHRK
jgi:hypothetical protein